MECALLTFVHLYLTEDLLHTDRTDWMCPDRERKLWVDKVVQCVQTSQYHQDMVEKISELVREISDRDDTVGGKIYILTV